MHGLNLLPWRERIRQAGIRRFQVMLLAVVMLAAMAVWTVDLIGRGIKRSHLQDHASIRRAIETADDRLAQMEQHKVEQVQLAQQLQALTHLKARRAHFAELVEQLESAVPQGVHLTLLTRQAQDLQIQGLAHSGALVAQLVRNLASGLGNVEIHQIKAVDEGEAFELSVSLRRAS